MLNISKKIINGKFVPHLSKGKRGPKCSVGLWRVVRAIIYRLKTGIQWRLLPMKSLFGRSLITWNAIYYYFQKWSKDGSWYRLWTAVLEHNKLMLNLSSIALDGSHTPAKRGGQAVGYQGRKKAKTTNMLFLTDKNGLPLACSFPVSGNHNDLFEIEKTMLEIIQTLEDAQIDYSGLFMNADAGFDCQKLRKLCSRLDIIPNFDFNKRNSANRDNHAYAFDDELYKERFSVERTNAWLDGFKNLIIRYETNAKHWVGLHYLAFSTMILRKVNRFVIKL